MSIWCKVINCVKALINRFIIVYGVKNVLWHWSQNIYKVKVDAKKRGSKLKSEKSPKELVCSAAKAIEIQTFLKGDEFFRRQQLDQYLPEKPLSLLRESFKTCFTVNGGGVSSNTGELVLSVRVSLWRQAPVLQRNANFLILTWNRASCSCYWGVRSLVMLL